MWQSETYASRGIVLAIRVQFGYSITSGCRCRPVSGFERDSSQVCTEFVYLRTVSYIIIGAACIRVQLAMSIRSL